MTSQSLQIKLLTVILSGVFIYESKMQIRTLSNENALGSNLREENQIFGAKSDPYMNDWGFFTAERYRKLLEKYPNQYMPTDEWMSQNSSTVVKTFSYLKIFSAVLFTLGDHFFGSLLILFAVLRLTFYYNPFFDQKVESEAQGELLDESDPLSDDTKFVLKYNQ